MNKIVSTHSLKLVAVCVFAVACGDKGETESRGKKEIAEVTEDVKTAEETRAEREASEFAAKVAEIKKDFEVSLHRTGAGMKHWYEKGSMALVGKKYEDLDCKNCHVKGCDSCHVDGDLYKALVPKEKCLKCHSRYKVTAALDKEAGVVDPHATMACTKCHTASDMHGDGKLHANMREPGFLDADCLNCHKEGVDGAKKFDPSTDSHGAHSNLACAACHTSNTVACLNCHFDSFLATGSRKGNFVKGKDWLLLVNYQNQITSGTLMTVVTNGKKYATFAPYATHSITARGRVCGDCHENEAVKAIAKGKSIGLAEFKDGTLVMRKGVVPVVKDKVLVPFLEKDDGGKWVEMTTKDAPTITFSNYAEPISQEQLENLAQKMD